MKRAIVIVLDSVGVGALPDAAAFGDEGSNTLSHVLDSAPLALPNLQSFGLGNLLSHPALPAAKEPQAIACKLATMSPGKDTLTGHWEMMGYPQAEPFPTYPQGFPQSVIAYIEQISRRPVLGNVAASGTEIILRLGEEAVQRGALIVYTSADSVLQIAAHEAVVPLGELYDICAQVHAHMLDSPHKVARVIARPFEGAAGQYRRTANRHDYSVKPGRTLLDQLSQTGRQVLAVGKIVDIFAGQGISQAWRTKNNAEGIGTTLELVRSRVGDLIFANLVDFDMLFGHRNDPIGYGQALEEFDRALAPLADALGADDLLVITADHGCDPTMPGTDHTREYAPCLVYHPRLERGRVLPPQSTLCAVGATVADWLSVQLPSCATSLLGGEG
ncbi:MAG: phosphopentomutase [Bacillota bacterium]|jgi:phosphopentomutase